MAFFILIETPVSETAVSIHCKYENNIPFLKKIPERSFGREAYMSTCRERGRLSQIQHWE